MTMAEALDQAGQELRAADGDEITFDRLKQLAAELCGCDVESIRPSDFCYNRTNKAIKLAAGGSRRPPYDRPVFLWVRRGVYKYVGHDFRYHGEVAHEPRGRR
ncbi:MAG: hypothetical protein K2X82_33240 [Gemmataceae bacterium]|nr:hypothetical protein [Gemmataceae bacterium]